MNEHPNKEVSVRTARCRFCKYMYAKDSGLINPEGKKWVCEFCRPIEKQSEETKNEHIQS